MAGIEDGLRDRIHSLEEQLARLEAQRALNSAADEALERALLERLPLDDTLGELMPLLLEHVRALGVRVRTFDESLELCDFGHDSQGHAFPISLDEVCEVTDRGEPFSWLGDGVVVLGQHLDVAGELFGSVAVSFEGLEGEQAQADARALVDVWCEVVDNQLAAIAQARRKLLAIQQISAALKEPVLDVGIDRAIDVLRDCVPFEDMLLVFRHEEDLEGVSLHYKIIQGGELTHDSRIPRDLDVDEFMRSQAIKMVEGRSRDLVSRFGITSYREELLINGVREEKLVGKLIVTSSRGRFNTYDRDLLERFADYLRQRIVDFNREWKHLQLCFAPATCHRLLEHEGYVEEDLGPRMADVAVLYCDISGFTRISEQVLRDPVLIARLVDTWSERAVDIIWDGGGVFDKMVGDCVIALWGPPFHDLDARTACRRAAAAARDIRDYTRSLNQGIDFPELAGLGEPIGVSTALQYCPLCVGLFGPNDDYTGFGSGMNSAARLQGVAARDEILCMDTFVRTYGEPEAFGPEQRAQVKNVAEPLRYQALRR